MRDNETTRVAAVLAHARDGNVQRAVDALMQLWITAPERDDIDLAAIDAWQAIEEAGAVDAAIAAGLALVRGGTKIRSHAFVELTERVPEPVVSELADLVLDAEWSVDPYLAAVFLRIAEHSWTATFKGILDRHQTRFATDDQAWQLALYVMTTSRIGDRVMMSRWFASWNEHPRLEMWAVAAYTATWFAGPSPADIHGHDLKRLVELASDACTHLAWDDSAAFFLCLRMVGDVQRGEWGTLDESMRKHREEILRACDASRLHHPVVRFANRFKHAHPVIGFQLDNPRAQLPKANDPRDRLVNRQLAEVVVDLARATQAALEALDLFVELDRTPRGHPNVIALARRMQHLDSTGAGGWMRTAWQRLLRQRVSVMQRFRLALS